MTARSNFWSVLTSRFGHQRQASTIAQRLRHKDPYALAQARAKKAANLSRQSVLRTERSQYLGDPVRGVETDFVKSLDPRYYEESQSINDASLSHFIKSDELRTVISETERLSQPLPDPENQRDVQKDEEKQAKHREQHKNAEAALERILSLNTSSSRDRTHSNIQRCIEEFGRHNTDKTLKDTLRGSNVSKIDTSDGKEASDVQGDGNFAERAGPDTGSPEVQIAILTAKIRAVAYGQDTFGRHDKVNKRNLRLLVHRRQKLLRYLRRKERAGERWQHLVGKLGLTEGTWKGEISL